MTMHEDQEMICVNSGARIAMTNIEPDEKTAMMAVAESGVEVLRIRANEVEFAGGHVVPLAAILAGVRGFADAVEAMAKGNR